MSLKEWQKMQSGFAAGFKASSQPQSCQHPSSLAAALVGRLSWVLKCLSRARSSQLTRSKKCPFSTDGLQWQLQKFHLSPPCIFISLQMSVEAVELLFFSNAEGKNASVATDLRGTGGWHFQHVLHGTNPECLRGSSGDSMELEMPRAAAGDVQTFSPGCCHSPKGLSITLVQVFITTCHRCWQGDI